MKTRLLVGLLIIGIVLVSGCAEKECKTAADCMEKTCLAADCRDNFCVYSPLSDCCGNDRCEQGETYETCVDDCPNCDDSNECTTDSFDFHEQKCVNEIINQCCGNGLCEIDIEAYENCPADCPNCDDDTDCTKDSFDYHEQKCIHSPIPGIVCCGNGICEVEEAYEACPIDCPSCDDENVCTEDSFDYHEQECVNELLIPCCGNEICDEDAEDYSSCAADCPDCNDNDELTGDSFNYATQKCEYVTYYVFEDFNDGSSSWLDPESPDCDIDPSASKCDPRWAFVDGMLTKVDAADLAHIGFGDPTWTDYKLRLRVKLEQGFVELSVRNYFIPALPEEANGAPSSKGAYAVTISKNQLRLWKDLVQNIDLESKGYAFTSYRFYDIRVEVKAGNIKVYVDEELQIDYTDTDNPILAGYLGLYISDKAYIDDVIVEAP